MNSNQLLNSQEARKLTDGNLFKGIFVLSALSQKSDKNGKTYYDITVADSMGSMDAKVWADGQWLDKSETSAASDDDRIPAEKIPQLVGKSVGINAKVTVYRGLQQFNFTKITLLNQEKYPAASYMPRSPIPMEDLLARFEALKSACGGPAGDFVRSVFSGSLWTKFRDWPAAVSHHHAYANGLLEHTISVAECARNMALSMKNAGYDVDENITTAGALLHDIGKLDSYNMVSVPEMNIEGALLDHIAQGYARYCELAQKFGLEEKTRLHLAHIILSHHGQREFGSPVVPATPEAMIVSSADELDFRMFCWNDSVKNLTDDQPISAWNNSTQRRFWKK